MSLQQPGRGYNPAQGEYSSNLSKSICKVFKFHVYHMTENVHAESM